jgi:transposase
MLVAQLRLIKLQIVDNDRKILALARSTELGRRLMEVGTSRNPSPIGV